ncbi:MAG: DUF1206 domain-containing protein [Actinomycetia bacterium]|nr:DUF1206 domain-containing protein [Actinomycetes bacterium]
MTSRAKDLHASTQQAANSPWLEGLARLGFVARGVVYVLIGFLALKIASGSGNPEADQQGAFSYVGRQSFGQVLLWALAIGLAGYGLWRLFQAITGQVDGPDRDKPGTHRLIDAVKGVIYLAFAFSAAAVAVHSSSGDSTQLTKSVMMQPWGPFLIGTIGLVIVVAGVAMVAQGWTRDFAKYLDSSKATGRARDLLVKLGRVGYVARGAVFMLAGAFVVFGAVQSSPQKTDGLDVALSSLADAPLGVALLIAVALGLIAFGLYSLAESRYRRV